MLVDKTIKEFMNELASNAPVPGGGGAAALVGAIGVGLGDMVGELTTGKAKYAAVEEEICALIAEAKALKDELLRLVDEDAEAFSPLAEAYKLPKDAPDRDEIMEKALRRAASAPEKTIRACGRALEITREFALKGSKLALSDAGCGAECCRAAIRSSYLNICINTKLMKDRQYAEALNEEAEAMLSRYDILADELFRMTAEQLR